MYSNLIALKPIKAKFMSIKVLIADDNRLFRELLAICFRETTDIEIVAQAFDGLDVLEKVKLSQPDVVLMDIRMPGMNGITATKILYEEFPKVKVIALTTFNDKIYIKAMLEANACGYLLKDSTFEQLEEAVRQVYSGKKCFSAVVEGFIIEDFIGRASQDNTKLTKRESQILRLLAEGKSIKDISESLFVSIKTVGSHKQNVFRKLEFKNMTQLIKYALNKGFVS